MFYFFGISANCCRVYRFGCLSDCRKLQRLYL